MVISAKEGNKVGKGCREYWTASITVWILDRVARNGLAEKVTFEPIFKLRQ